MNCIVQHMLKLVMEITYPIKELLNFLSSFSMENWYSVQIKSVVNLNLLVHI